ncbi:MAG: porin [Halioglobus sp.]|nr:porin [Halioglobus sp.]
MPFISIRRSILVGATLCMAPQFSFADGAAAEGFTDMFSQGSIGIDFRYRYEYVDDDSFGQDANASTLRSLLTFESASYAGFSLLTQLANVAYIGADDFNSTENGKTQYPVVPDPKGSEVNQAWLRYSHSDVSGTFGRQRIVLDDQRFIGDVGWRQNDQTFDGFRSQWQSQVGLALDYAYVYRVNRIFGPDNTSAQPAQWRGDNHFIHLQYTLLENHSIVGFAYLLDIDDRTGWAPGRSVDNSSDSYGLRYSGVFGAFSLNASYAYQTDAGDSSLDYAANYYAVEGGASLFGVKATLGYEVLASDNGVGFKTPLATLHKFQGWADKFLVTPDDGIQDLYLGIAGAVGPLKLAATWHDFQAEQASQDFGTELDLAATWPVSERWSLQLKYASFSADNSAPLEDTQKLWMTVQFSI